MKARRDEKNGKGIGKNQEGKRGGEKMGKREKLADSTGEVTNEI